MKAIIYIRNYASKRTTARVKLFNDLRHLRNYESKVNRALDRKVVGHEIINS